MALSDRTTAIAALALVAVLLAGCGGGSDADTSATSGGSTPADGSGATATVTSSITGPYVALGSSFAAGTGLPDRTDTTCEESQRNYAHLAAARLGLALIDSSCARATTANLTTVDQQGRPPQVQTIPSNAGLITVTVGEHDVDFVLTATTCGINATAGKPCPLSFVRTDAENAARFAALTGHLVDVLRQARFRAPKARIVLVGHPRLVGEPARTCAPRVPMRDADLAYVAQMGLRLQAASEAAAESADVEFLDVYRASTGHDACEASGTRWVEGAAPARGGAAWHPNRLGHRAEADLLVALLTRPR